MGYYAIEFYYVSNDYYLQEVFYFTIFPVTYEDAVKTAEAELEATEGVTARIVLPSRPLDLAFGEVTNSNPELIDITVDVINRRIYATSKVNLTEEELENVTVTVEYAGDIDHLGYTVTATIELTAHVHTYEAVESIKPTCTSRGVKGYYACDCGLFFEKVGDEYVEIDDLDAWVNEEGYIAPLGHEYEISYVWNYKDKTCTAIKDCIEGDSTKSETVEYTVVDGKYTAEFVDSEFETQISDLPIPAERHMASGVKVAIIVASIGAVAVLLFLILYKRKS